jgi:hypothetical protein
MYLTPFWLNVAVASLVLVSLTSTGQSQEPVPAISARQFTGGSARITVTGAFQIDEEVAINTVASMSDGEMTWLQFGNSGSATPNALITYQQGEYGVSVSKGKNIAVGEAAQCRGKVEVTQSSMTGQYTCSGVTSYDAGSGNMGTINIQIRFTARS